MPPSWPEIARYGWYGAGILLGVMYAATIGYFRQHWRRLPSYRLPTGYYPQTHISVIIPARNEEGGIGDCLSAVLQQSYPSHLYEVIVVDDFSTDATADEIRAVVDDRLRLISLAESLSGGGKKQALSAGVGGAQGELIVTLDADCLPGSDWLAVMAFCYESRRPAFIAAPVLFHQENTLWERFQSLDMLGMMLLTGAGIRSGRLQMANGANMAFTKAAFEAVGGYAGVDSFASGDDIFLLQKISASFPGRVVFLANPKAAVCTKGHSGWPPFLRQRLRWGTKNRRLSAAPFTTAVLALIFFLCWWILLSAAGSLWAGTPTALFAAGLFLAKSAVDYGMLREAARFFQRTDLLRSFWPSQVLHIAYIALVGLLANVVRTYEWKGRKVK